MTIAPTRGAPAYADLNMGKASRLPPEGPANFPAPRHQHITSAHPKTANDTDRVRQNDPQMQCGQALFRRRTKAQQAIARARMEQFGRLVIDMFGGPCLTSRAGEVVEQFIPFVADACGQSGFYWMMNEVIALHAPLLKPAELNEIFKRTLPDPVSFKSAAVGKRWGVTPEQYERLALFHITPAAWGPRKLNNHRRSRRNSRVKATRHATRETKTPRELSVARLKPWERDDAHCNSRLGWFRLPAEIREPILAQARAEALVRR